MLCFMIIGGGQGEKVERLYREVRAYAIPGGSEGMFMDSFKYTNPYLWDNAFQF